MPTRFWVLCTIAAVMAGCAPGGGTMRRPGTATSAPADARPPRPFFDARTQPVEYVGPGREDPPPGNVGEVKIGWFGPSEPDHATAGLMWCAAKTALDEANRSGGYEGRPFRLVTAWSENPWGTGVKQVTRLVYDEKVWAIIGSPDGPSAHLVEQVVAKARLTFVSPVSTDKTTNLVNVPWIFSCAPGDHVLTPVLAKAIAAQARGQGFVLISCTDHDSRLTTTELLAALRRLKMFPKRHLQFSGGAVDFAAHLQAVRDAEPAAVVVIAGPLDSARFVTAFRRCGFDLPVLGGPAMGRFAFLKHAGESAEGVIFPLLWDPDTVGEGAQEFTGRFDRRFGTAPDYTAAYTYDAMNLLVAAIRKAGLNRVRIRDAVRELSPRPGVTGTITWDPTGHNRRSVILGTIRNGRFIPAPSGGGPPATAPSNREKD